MTYICIFYITGYHFNILEVSYTSLYTHTYSVCHIVYAIYSRVYLNETPNADITSHHIALQLRYHHHNITCSRGHTCPSEDINVSPPSPRMIICHK